MEDKHSLLQEEIKKFVLAYENALALGDVDTQDAICWQSEQVIAYGMTDEFKGNSALRSFRARRQPGTVTRTPLSVDILVLSETSGVAAMTFVLPGGDICRQSIVCAKIQGKWTIMHNHASRRTAR